MGPEAANIAGDPTVDAFDWITPAPRMRGAEKTTRPVTTASKEVFVCLLGGFRILKGGAPVPMRPGGKVEQVLGHLAMTPRLGLPREDLLERVWPSSDLRLAGQSLNTISHWLKQQLADALAGNAPIVRQAGRYSLNTRAGLKIDLLEFEAAVESGRRHQSAGDGHAALASYQRALDLYVGDLSIGSDVRHLLERERLRATYLATLAIVADHYFAAGDYELSLHKALLLLAADPIREDAHRMAMRCFVRIGQRAQALRQYQICQRILEVEFDAVPEPATEALFRLIRRNPGLV